MDNGHHTLGAFTAGTERLSDGVDSREPGLTVWTWKRKFPRAAMTPEICPNCGAEVPRKARACPECGACDETGWSERARYDGLDLPDDSFDYDEFTRREFGEARRSPPRRWLIPVAAGLLILALLGWLL